jgi:ATP-dependent DNA helicase DinG
MSLHGCVLRAFEAGGPLAAIEAYSPRPGQALMAMEVAKTMEMGGVLVVEAGTGVGKTFAYLVPVLLSGERVLLSTATKALQDQLFGRDIPALMTLLGLSARVALLKGRASYLCLHRLADARHSRVSDAPAMQQQLAAIEAWSVATRSGDLAELDQVQDDSPLIPLVTSTRENCLGARCPQSHRCHVNLARREAMAADVVVVNHHLFFADLNVRESGIAELLPIVRTVVFDEAHQLNEVGVQFLGRQFSTGQLTNLASDLSRISLQHARGLLPWHAMGKKLDDARDRLCSVFTNAPGRRKWKSGVPDGISINTWAEVMSDLVHSLGDLEQSLVLVAELHPELGALLQRAQSLVENLRLFEQPLQAGFVRWLEVDRQVRLVHSPLDISAAMRSRVLVSGDSGVGKSWVFTSATLGHDASLSWFTQRCGLQDAKVLRVASPFNYPVQAAVYVPSGLPAPGDPHHADAVALFVAESAAILGGRTLVLTTSLRSMRAIGDALRDSLGLPGQPVVLVQGEAPKRELLARFCRETKMGQGYILVASTSFWEGIDVPGAALQLVVIDKLPFAPPEDPLVQARSLQLEAQGKNPFIELHLPHAAVALKQGAGRLIRRETDLGVLVVCDVRLTRMGYGKKLLAALPPMRLLAGHADYVEALRALTRPSTRVWPVF